MARVQVFEEPLSTSVSTSSHGTLDSNHFLETGPSAIRQDTISHLMHLQADSDLRKPFDSRTCRVSLRTMASVHNHDCIHDEYGPAEILEAAIVQSQRASVIYIKPFRCDEAASCLARLGMRWLNRSEIMSESRRRNLCLDALEEQDRQQSSHQAATYATSTASR